MYTDEGIDVYDIGDPAILEANFTNAAGAATNPTTVRFIYSDPSGVETIVAQGDLTNSEVGTWKYTLTLTAHGIWRWRAEGTGAVQQAGDEFFYVRRSFLAD